MCVDRICRVVFVVVEVAGGDGRGCASPSKSVQFKLAVSVCICMYIYKVRIYYTLHKYNLREFVLNSHHPSPRLE